MLDRYSSTIDRIYAAAGDSALWTDALRAIEDLTGSTGAVLNMVPKVEAAPPIALSGSFSESDCTDYALNYMWRCPRIAFAAKHPDIRIAYDHLIMTESEMDRDATYEWYGKHGLRYYVAGWIGETARHRAYMSLQRSRRQGHVEPEEVTQFTAVLGHMSHALALACRLGTLEEQCRLSQQALDANRNAIFVLNEEGSQFSTNLAGEKLLERGDIFSMRAGRLECAVETEQFGWQRLVDSASGKAEGQSRGGWTRIRKKSGSPACFCLIAPLVESLGLFGSGPLVMVTVFDPAAESCPNEQALTELFGLTFAEAHFARTLAAGHSVESAAALLGIRPATGRSHLKAVFRKTGVNRQQDLVRLLWSLAAV